MSPQSRAERLIAGGRVALAASSLFAVWLDPSEPAKYASIAYSLLVSYVVYSIAIAVLAWRSDAPSNPRPSRSGGSSSNGGCEGTVKIHLHNIYQKLEVSGRLELAVHARSKGLI